MHPGALPTRFLLEPRALPADAERVVHSMALDAHDAPSGRAANRDGVRAEAVADVLRPDDILNGTSGNLGEPAALGTNDHGPCLAERQRVTRQARPIEEGESLWAGRPRPPGRDPAGRADPEIAMRPSS
jgi:hypothetical protein